MLYPCFRIYITGYVNNHQMVLVKVQKWYTQKNVKKKSKKTLNGIYKSEKIR